MHLPAAIQICCLCNVQGAGKPATARGALSSISYIGPMVSGMDARPPVAVAAAAPSMAPLITEVPPACSCCVQYAADQRSSSHTNIFLCLWTLAVAIACTNSLSVSNPCAACFYISMKMLLDPAHCLSPSSYMITIDHMTLLSPVIGGQLLCALISR